MPINYDEYLRASNGTGEAVRANVVLGRPVGSTEINVDSVLNWPSKFIATSGMVDNATGTFDPATVTVFFGHLNGTYIEIDEFAPGYPDRGNDENEIIVLKPTTSWADKVALRVALPVGGTTDQVLTKNSSTNGDASWKDPSGNSTWVFNIVPSGTINGTNPTFTLPSAATNIILTLNGIVLRPGAGNDYTLSGNTITMLGSSIPTTGSTLLASYTTGTSAMVQGSSSFVWKVAASGTKNGTNTAFTTPGGQAYIGGTLQAYVNGIAQGLSVTETNPASGAFTFDVAPLSTDEIELSYMVAAAVSANADTVDNFNASSTPTANTLLPLDANGKIPVTVVDTPYQVTGVYRNFYAQSNQTVTAGNSYSFTGISLPRTIGADETVILVPSQAFWCIPRVTGFGSNTFDFSFDAPVATAGAKVTWTAVYYKSN